MNVREVIDELCGQFEDYKSVLEAVVLMSPGRYRLTFRSSRKLASAEQAGLIIRGLPVTFQPVSSLKWVNISRLSYGVPEDQVHLALQSW